MPTSDRSNFESKLIIVSNFLNISTTSRRKLLKAIQDMRILFKITAINELSKQFLHWFYPHEQDKLMKLFGLGKGEQNHDLRKRKPVLLSEE